MKNLLPIPMSRPVLATVLALLLIGFTAVPLQAQDREEPPQREFRTFIPQDQVVSFSPNASFEQFVDFLNPIFQRVFDKQVIDPEGRTRDIGISISGMYFFDAFDLVLDANNLTYRETDRFFFIEEARPSQQRGVAANGATGEQPARVTTVSGDDRLNLDTRDIQINAILFSLDVNRARDIGLNWNSFLAGDGAGGDIQVRTGGIADATDDVLVLPREISAQRLQEFINISESRGAGETIASPRVTVQSGEQGNIQIGSDIPFTTRDFAGNTITQFVNTGIIIDVTPTLITQPIADTLGAPLVDFVDLEVRVENSSGQVTPSGPIVDRNTAQTRVMLLDGEQTVIGGLVSTEESESRRGIPILKDLPGWFFGIRYLTGLTSTTLIQRELLIVLQATLVDPLRQRAGRPFEQDLLQRSREEADRVLRRFDDNAADRIEYLNPRVYGERPAPQHSNPRHETRRPNAQDTNDSDANSSNE